MNQTQKTQLADQLRKKTDELNALVKQAKESGLEVSIFAPHFVADVQPVSVIVKETTKY